jgi:hypothetical protein
MTERGSGGRSAGATWPPLNPKWLFGVAAVFNLAVGASLLLARPMLTSLLRLEPATGTNLVTYYLTASFVSLFGYSYARVAFEPDRYKEYIPFGLIGKLLAVVAIIAIAGVVTLPPMVLALAGGDLVFSVLFIAFLRQTARREGRSRSPSAER